MANAVVDHTPVLSIIIPTLNEATTIVETLHHLQSVRGQATELIVVDAGSKDETVRLASPLVDRVITCEPGRALQMNAGARVSQGEVLWFLHADTLVSPDARQAILDEMKEGLHLWGRFDIRLSGQAALLRVVERMMNLRSRITGIATGDQGIFVHRSSFLRVGGFTEIPLMEDIDLSRKLKRAAGNPACLPVKIITSSRRWETHGILRTIWLMWRLRLAYALGVSPARLARQYR